MAAGDLVQVGIPIEVGMGGMVFKSIIQTVKGPKRSADVTEIRDERDAVVTKLYTNPSRTITFDVIVKDASHADLGAFELLMPGSVVILNTGGTHGSRSDEDWLIEDVDIDRQSKQTTASVTAKREDSLGAAIDAVVTSVDLTA